jgi:gamma-glutamylcyclotransferase (GGCT)/AIG2-like uncharacterized protein YtfP
MQKPFILKYNDERRQVELQSVTYPPITRVKEVINIRGIGNIGMSECTGKFDKSKFSLWTTRGNITIAATKDGVHGRIRRLREQEAKLLDEIDAQMAELRSRRAEIVKLAWQKANVVTVKELAEQADEKEKRGQRT